MQALEVHNEKFELNGTRRNDAYVEKTAPIDVMLICDPLPVGEEHGVPRRPLASDCVNPDVVDFQRHLQYASEEGSASAPHLSELNSPEATPDQRQMHSRAESFASGRSSRRLRSWCSGDSRTALVGDYRWMCEPGGFRRSHLHLRADQQGVPFSRRPAVWSTSLISNLLSAGRDFGDSLLYNAASFGEHQMFMPPAHTEDSGASRSVLGSFGIAVAIFKGNLNANILYMPHAWKETGWVFSLIVLPLLGVLSTMCVIRLLRCREGNNLSYGQLMEQAAGHKGRVAVNISVTLLQCGCCCLYLINGSNLLRATVLPQVSRTALIVLEALVIAPLAAIRNVSKLGYVNVLASLLVVFAITSTVIQLVSHLAYEGPGDEFDTVKPSGILVGLGTACFVFEGIGLVTSIYDSCRYPEKFTLVYSSVIGSIVVLISAVAFMGYYCFGEETETLVLLNLPTGRMQSAIKLAMGVAMLSTFPLQLLPAIRIVEEGAGFKASQTLGDKIKKSCFRFIFVAFLAVVSIGGATSLSNFVSMVGALCGLPLAYVYPAICHLNLVSSVPDGLRAHLSSTSTTSSPRKWGASALMDVGCIVFGVLFTVIITAQNILSWGEDAG